MRERQRIERNRHHKRCMKRITEQVSSACSKRATSVMTVKAILVRKFSLAYICAMASICCQLVTDAAATSRVCEQQQTEASKDSNGRHHCEAQRVLSDRPSASPHVDFNPEPSSWLEYFRWTPEDEQAHDEVMLMCDQCT